MLDKEFKVTTLVAKDISLPGRKAFAFARSEEKVTAFLDWLEKQEQKGILEIGTMRQIGTPIETAWTNKYIKDAYMRGVQRARWELKGAGYEVPTMEASGGINAYLVSQPLHLDRMGVLYSRVFQELKGITSQMDTQISRVLTQGIADGKHPHELAKLLTRTIKGPVGGLGITDTLKRWALRRPNRHLRQLRPTLQSLAAYCLTPFWRRQAVPAFSTVIRMVSKFV